MTFGIKTGELPDKLALTCHPWEGFNKRQVSYFIELSGDCDQQTINNWTA